jgi:hypothetical protein
MTQFSSDRGGAVLEAVGITFSHDLTDVQHLSLQISPTHSLTHSLTHSSLRYCYADFDIECHSIPVWGSLFNPLPRYYNSVGFIWFYSQRPYGLEIVHMYCVGGLESVWLGRLRCKCYMQKKLARHIRHACFTILRINIHKHVSALRTRTWLKMFAPCSLRFLYFQASGY